MVTSPGNGKRLRMDPGCEDAPAIMRSLRHVEKQPVAAAGRRLMLRSVRARLTLWYTAILALVLITFSGICYALLAQEIRAATDASLADTAREFAGAFANDRVNGSEGRDVLLDFHYSDRPSNEYRESIEVIQKAAGRLTRLVQNLFLLARADAGSYPISKTRFYFDEFLSDCARAMRSVAMVRGVALTCQAPPDLVIYGDEELLHRMFLNLVDNAVKFTPAGGRVEVRAESTANGFVIRVNDTGPGISSADAPRIFDRFFRGDRLRSRATGNDSGAGLGLPIARWIAEAHEGTLTLESSGAGGSTFVVSLPALEGRDAPLEEGTSAPV